MGRAPRPEPVISNFREDEIPEVAAVERASFTTPWNEILFFNELKKEISLFRVARLAESIAGYLCVNLVLGEAEVMTFAVAEEMRGQGIATSLFMDMLKLLRERSCNVIHLEVRESNAAARSMYRKFGFREVAVRKGYYTKPDEDGIVMRRVMGEDSG